MSCSRISAASGRPALGVAASEALADHPDLLALSSSGFGHDGPRAAYRAYAYNLQASSGLCYLTRSQDGEPAEIDIAWADLISAYTLATIVAAWAVGPCGNCGTGVDFAMVDLVIAHFNEFLAAASLDPDSDVSVDRANELSPYAPHGVYRTADGWIALSVDDDDAFDRLVKVLVLDVSRDQRFANADDRLEHRRVLDAQIAEGTRRHTASDLAAELRGGRRPGRRRRDGRGSPCESATGVAGVPCGGRASRVGTSASRRYPVAAVRPGGARAWPTADTHNARGQPGRGLTGALLEALAGRRPLG